MISECICAIDSVSGKYVLPEYASKSAHYNCPDCENEVIVRKGEIRRPHFAHKAQTTPCSYFDHPNESQQHKICKLLLAAYLEMNKTLTMFYTCCDSATPHISNEDIKLCDGDEIIVEYRDPVGKYVADLAIVNGGKPRIIFEIYHTHKTNTRDRPEPWYEIDTCDILDKVKTDIASHDVKFQCSRKRDHYDSKCIQCRLGLDELGAIDKCTGSFVFPIQRYALNELVCLDCKHPVSLVGTMFKHTNPSTCQMYNYPSLEQIQQNTVLKLASLLRDRTVKTTCASSCAGTFFAGQCNNSPSPCLITYTEDDVISMNRKKGYVKIRNHTRTITFIVKHAAIDAHTEHSAHKIYVSSISKRPHTDKYELTIANTTNMHCNCCKRIETYKNYMTKIPRIAYRDEFTCIHCNSDSIFWESLFLDGWHRAICFECLVNLDIDKIRKYVPRPLFVE